MSISRRGFLKAILAAASAPAIVRAESLMPIFVPRQDLILPGSNAYLEVNKMFEGFGDGDFTIETWIQPTTGPESGVWRHLAQTQRNGHWLSYVDGKLVPNGEFETLGFKVVKNNDRFTVGFDTAPSGIVEPGYFTGQIDDLRITSGVARSTAELSCGQRSDRHGLTADYLCEFGNNAKREVARFEGSVRRGIDKLESFVDRAEHVAKQETPSGLLAALLDRC